MHPRTRYTLRLCLALVLSATLLVLPNISFVASETVQRKNSAQQPPPHRGKPEGILPDLEEVKNESDVTREAPAPIHSTVRSPKLSEKPWNGRRVGDPDQLEKPLDQAVTIDKKTRRSHASRRTNPAPPPIYEDQFIQNFFSLVLLRSTSYDEGLFWNYQLRAAYNQGQTSLKLAAVELGKTLFESASYAARNRDNHWYVYDLYKSFLMREPDVSGWAYWESMVPINGRVNIRRAFEEAPEFATLLTTIALSGSGGPNPAS